MIDTKKRQEKNQEKEKVRRRMRVEIDPENYEYIPAKKPIDYYDNEVPQRVAIYVRVSTDDVRQTTSYELQKKYYEDSLLNLGFKIGFDEAGNNEYRKLLKNYDEVGREYYWKVGVPEEVKEAYDWLGQYYKAKNKKK